MHNITQNGRLLISVTSILLPMAAAWWSGRLIGGPAPGDAADVAELEIHRAPGAERAGTPAVADPSHRGTVKLRVIDAESRQPVYCRVNVVGSDGNYYEPADKALAPWSLHRLGNRNGKGPFRYYGWFFYCDGTCDVAVPPGKTRIEVWKGFEYQPMTATVDVAQGRIDAVTVPIRRAIDMAARGWYSGDTHIHLNRRDRLDDERALDLAAAEDIRFAHVLCMNDPRSYAPLMNQQIWPQNFGLGGKSERFRGRYGISSGQEYRCNTFGHICLVGGSGLVEADGSNTDPNNWPVFGAVADELHALGGLAFQAHGGYEKEIYADFAQGTTDGVELLQFAVYRGIALEGWYHILNAGFRFPAVAASDYPYCRALGDCRTYVYLGEEQPTFTNWDRAAADGRSFLTTGPLLELSVEDKRPGDTVMLAAGGRSMPVTVQFTSPTVPVDELQLIEGGRVVHRRKLPLTPSPSPTGRGVRGEGAGPFTWRVDCRVEESTWLAVRAFSRSAAGREDVEAHTNPVYVSVDGGRPLHRDSVRWLRDKLDEQIAYHSRRNFAEKDKVLAYFRKSRAILSALLERVK